MSVKYTIPFKTIDDVSCIIEIESVTYLGVPIVLRSVEKAAGVLSYDGVAQDPFGVLVPSTLSIRIYNQSNIDVKELQRSQDRDWVVKFYRAGVPYWVGYLQTEGISRMLISNPTYVDLSAICGLTMLADIDYNHGELDGGRCPMNYIRQILFSPYNLGIALPIRWTNTLQCSAFLGQDVFTGGVRWAVDNQGFYSYQAGENGNDGGPIKKCGEILEEMLRAFQCRIYQTGGRWVIRRVNDVANGSGPYKQIADNLGPMTVQSGTDNLLKLIGRSGYPFQNEDALMTSIQGLKTVKVEYEANVRENILPNGSQDATYNNGVTNQPLYWGFYEPDTELFLTTAPGIDGRSGESVHLSNGEGGVGDLWYSLKTAGGTYGEDGLPIDTKTLVKKLSLGFLISIVGGVFVEPETDIIVWDNEPIKMQVIYNLNGVKYYLTEFGFWEVTPTDIAIIIQGLALNEVARVDFDKFQGIIMPTDGVQPTPTDTSDITVAFRLRDNLDYYLDNIYINIEPANDVYESTYIPTRNTTEEARILKISSSFGGYLISNFMSAWNKSDEEFFFRDGVFYEGSLTGLTANAMMRFRYKPSEIFNGTINARNSNWSFDQIYLIDTFGTEKYLPLNAKYNIESSEVYLIAMECRNDQIELTEKYYSSNDKTLSN